MSPQPMPELIEVINVRLALAKEHAGELRNDAVVSTAR